MRAAQRNYAYIMIPDGGSLKLRHLRTVIADLSSE